jgi:UPF0755 protein
MLAILKLLKFITLFILCFVIVSVVESFYEFLETPIIPAGQAFVYTIDKGATLSRIANDLTRRHLLLYPKYFELLGRWHHYDKKIHAGQYQLTGPLKPEGLLQVLISGKTMLNKITLIEGVRFSDAMRIINNNQTIKHTLTNTNDLALLQILGSKATSPEGLFFPDTYYFSVGSTDVAFLKNAYEIMNKHLQQEWDARDPAVPYKDLYEALIAASLIEKESALALERPKIAAVLIHRLKKGMLLQIDPTVIYGMGARYKGNLLLSDLRQESPYNTYLHKGLPPTPIALPSLSAIHAALHPAPGDDLYFVANGDGGHIFSNTLNEHNQAVQKYHQWQHKMLQQRSENALKLLRQAINKAGIKIATSVSAP